MPGRNRLTGTLRFVALCGPWLAVVGCAHGGAGGLRPRPSDEDVWAIRCVSLQGTDGPRRAAAYAAALKQVPNLKPDLVQVIGDEDGTAVYYGRYARNYGTDDPQEMYRPSHLRDLETIRSLRYQGREVWPFLLATMDVLPTYRPAHPEWDLNHVEGYWSVHVGAFENTRDFHARRSAAEQYCALLREEGHEAYFHHGPAISSVYVGVFPEDAVVEVQRENPLTGVLRAGIEIVDPQMKKAMETFPHSLHNGGTAYNIIRDPRTNEVKERVPTPSFPVRTPAGQRQYEGGAG